MINVHTFLNKAYLTEATPTETPAWPYDVDGDQQRTLWLVGIIHSPANFHPNLERCRRGYQLQQCQWAFEADYLSPRYVKRNSTHCILAWVYCMRRSVSMCECVYVSVYVFVRLNASFVDRTIAVADKSVIFHHQIS